jgi:hypothetical protein
MANVGILALVICIVGAVVYCATDRKIDKLGFWAYVLGLFVFLANAAKAFEFLR